ncbi:hypothetical protein PI124_g8578 [Phytophthora idaei]|uniref:Uncharacterized protein n=1 Tax=Phytophthora aleatoria TaxID=2496075 RepID=A0A8J5MHZ6_9STRA|nr:hypothetical protein PI125_g3545 [Phytophthora idaei]KAG3246693.1 hypothetical protein PI124_g8578 [Phytophthora idaei]KAG6971136.1 hypothetical protein JG688_00004571 [Phytophthora aleatoria]
MTTREEPLLKEERLHTGTRGPPFDFDGFANQVKVGDGVDALDCEHNWRRARAVEIAEDEVKVHYQGTQAKCDEWIPRSGRRLVPRGLKAPK